MGVSQADNSVKIGQNLPIRNSKPDLYKINAYTKFGENPLMFSQVLRKQTKENTTTKKKTRTDVRLNDE